MKLKVDTDGKPVFVDGLPVFTHADGKDIPLDAKKVVDALHDRNKEAQTNREKAEALETKLAKFGDLDPDVAKAAILKVKDFDPTKQVPAAQLESVKTELNTAWQGKFDAEKAGRESAEGKLNKYVLGQSFTDSKFLKEKTTLLPDFAQSHFGQNCRIGDNGKVTVYTDTDGKNPVYSRKSPGEIAGFDEGMEILIDQNPNRASILKGAAIGGANANPSGGGGQGGAGGGGKTMTRASFDALDAPLRNAFVADKGQVVD